MLFVHVDLFIAKEYNIIVIKIIQIFIISVVYCDFIVVFYLFVNGQMKKKEGKKIFYCAVFGTALHKSVAKREQMFYNMNVRQEGFRTSKAEAKKCIEKK